MEKQLFQINPDLDRQALAARFARDTRLQVENVLTDETARELRDILMHRTRWGVAFQSGTHGTPHSYRAQELQDRALAQRAMEELKQTDAAAAARDYAFRCHRYSLVEAYLGQWEPGGPHDLILEYLNAPDFIGLMQELTGIPEIVKADGHVTCYGANHFLGKHIDSHVMEGWRIAYVLNLTIDDWYEDWGGYLVFYDEEGDIVQGFKPKFNSLNFFMVPQPHAVTYVPPFAPRGRYAIGGWLRDR